MAGGNTAREDCCLSIRACSRELGQRLDVAMLLEQEAIARAQAKQTPLGHLMFTDGFRLEDTSVGYPIVWNNGQSCMVVKTHDWPQPGGIRRGCPRPSQGSRDRSGSYSPINHTRCQSN